MGLLELTAAVVAAVLGWQVGRLGQRELKGIVIVVLGWTAVTTIASLPYLGFADIAPALVWRALLVGGPYTVMALARRVQERRR